MITNVEEMLRKEEGEVLHAYQDHLGYWTIGVGILIDQRKGGGLRREESDYILRNRIRILEERIRAPLHFYDTLNPPRKAVLLSMAFQMGLEGLLQFVNTLRAVKEERYHDAAAGMLASKWATQTPERVKRMARQMETGEWQQ